MDYKKEDIKEITFLIGGVENIEKVYHCMTRLRFVLKDDKLFDTQAIKKLKFVQGVILSSGEFQIIIGTSVNKLYKLFCEQNAITTDLSKKDTSKLEVKKPKKSFLTFISQVFAPLLIVLVAIGFWEMLRMPIFLASNTSDEKWLQDLNEFTETISRGFTYFIVIGVAWSTFKVMGGNEIYGIVIAVILCNPKLTALSDLKVENGQTILGQMPGWSIFGDVVYPWKISFEGLVIPMVLVAFMGVSIQKLLAKANFGNFRMLIEPLIVIITTALISILIIAPIGLLFTSYLSIAFKYLMTNNITKYIFTPIIGALYSPMVIFGIHRTITPIIMQDIAQFKGSLILGLLILSNVSTAVATFAFGLRYKNNSKVKQIAWTNATSGFIAGVTEPCIYSIGLKYIFPMLGAVIGTYFGCLLYTASGVWTSTAPFGFLGVIGFISGPPQEIELSTWVGGSGLWGALSMLTTILVSFFSTLLLSKIKFFNKRTLKIFKEEYDFDFYKVNSEIIKLRQDYKTELKTYLKENENKKENHIKIKELKLDYKKNINLLKGAENEKN
ncbi:PTS transporter subunit EIIB [Spiroplasma endosymbiont of Cantharis nigra]|uniref:PTS transporter subunit EIIB n=1 Tax=Spiroplasma endosymbiont of Cantharis nigra TaxID=3066278 RepID=UPI0030CF6123